MKRHQYKRIAIRGVMGLILGLGLSAQVAIAAPAQPALFNSYLPQDSILRHATPVPDAQLARMRGRFVQGSRITHFGLVMASRLQSATQTLTGNLMVLADLSGNTPVVALDSDVTITGTDSAASVASVMSGGATGHTGASNRDFHGTFQTVQAAGDFNTGYNTFNVSIVGDTSIATTFATGPGAALAVAGSDAVRIMSTPDTVGINLRLSNGSQVRQSISSGRGLRQAIRLQGDGLFGQNMTSLQVGVTRLPHITETAGMAAAVRSLRDLAP